MNIVALVVVVSSFSSTLGFLLPFCNSNSDCQHGGSCEGLGGLKRCQCRHNYVGDFCEIDLGHICDSSSSSSSSGLIIEIHVGMPEPRCHGNGRCAATRSPPYYYCHCENGYHGQDCQYAPAPDQILLSYSVVFTATMPQPTTTLPSTPPATTLTQTTPTTSLPTTTPPTRMSSTGQTTTLSQMYTDTPRCSKFKTDFDIAGNIISHNALASVCPKSGNHSTPEAFVLNHCTLKNTNPQGWRIGHQVMSNCAAVPPYTPVFETFGIYGPDTHRSGIFLECLPEPEGFKIAYQPCDSTPTIEHVSSSEAQLFYTVN
ncbi:uncharacterized protein LOC127847405 isoform X2 [Dreissena polymorpha]|uniref:uncharacterized protein LOC127847405 isoform X2 n=1 Tax=Dreissena polymorpha TaxID=45954 RepID=UPI0022649550|nr:uncharacterized protein LOC127847405 isoform X2 [Dreissena polymorpha]